VAKLNEIRDRKEASELTRDPALPKGPSAQKARQQDVIGVALQAHFDDLLSEPVPDQMLSLLAALEARERSRQ
jgi:Anti-sigma factor NepR